MEARWHIDMSSASGSEGPGSSLDILSFMELEMMEDLWDSNFIRESNWDMEVEESILVWTLSTKRRAENSDLQGPAPHSIHYIHVTHMKLDYLQHLWFLSWGPVSMTFREQKSINI